MNLEEPFEAFSNHLEAYTYFTNTVLVSSEASIPKTAGKPRRPAVPWWDKKCSILRKIARRCYKKYQSNGSPTNKRIYQRALAKKVNISVVQREIPGYIILMGYIQKPLPEIFGER